MTHPAHGARFVRGLRDLRPWELAVAVGVLSSLALSSASAASPGAVRSLLDSAARSMSTTQRQQAVVPVAQPVVAPAPVSVRPLGHLLEPDLLITSTSPLGARARALVLHSPGVRHLLSFSYGAVRLGATTVHVAAVDPGQLRPWTPAPTARSDALWRTVAEGSAAASFDAGRNLRLDLGGPLSLVGRAPVTTTLGALASTGLPGVDLTVAPQLGGTLGLTPDTALLVSAPRTDLVHLRDQLRTALGPRTSVVLLRQLVVVRDAGSYLTRQQIRTALQTALKQVGKPYVWGATGPSSFDCSGLVGYAFAAAGISLPRTSEQLWLAGPHVPAKDARPGDLLFWANDPAAPMDMDHVAIYLGSGLMVSAPSTGEVVHVARVPSTNFRGVVRLDPAAAARVGGPMWALGG